jgi:signal peptidase complex subunit 3
VPKKSGKAGLSSLRDTGNKEANPGVIRLKNSKPKYQITDITGNLASRENVTLEVGWNVQPWVGALTWTLKEGRSFGRWNGIKGGKSSAFNMPALKGKSPVQEKSRSHSEKPKPAEASAVI